MATVADGLTCSPIIAVEQLVKHSENTFCICLYLWFELESRGIGREPR